MTHNRGFTLIELLVVIAIIGVLAAIVLASLRVARQKSADAKVQEQLNSLRNAAEVFFTANNNYGFAASPAETNCATQGMALDGVSGFGHLVDSAAWPDQTAPTCVNNATDIVPATAYAAWHTLTDGTYWCVDSTGVSRSVVSSINPAATSCP